MSEELSFVIDTASGINDKSVKTFNSSFPIFNNSKFTLDDEDEDENSDSSESDGKTSDEYFGKYP